MIDSTAQTGQLMLQLRKMKFAVNGGRNEFGYFFFKADMYSKINRTYQKIQSIDTSILVKNPEVTTALFLYSSGLIVDFIKSGLVQVPVEEAKLTLNDILEIEKVDKYSVKRDTADNFVDGLYPDHNSFLSQTPTGKIIVKIENGLITSVIMVSDNNKKTKVDPTKVYALVFRGKIYMPTDLGYYPLLLE